jgi:hypothetical protein
VIFVALRLILVLALIVLAPTFPQGSPEEATFYLAHLASPRFAEREAAESILHRCCLQDKANILRVGAALDSDDGEVRWRAARILRSVARCGWCRGTGISPESMYAATYTVTKGNVCIYCEGTGALWKPGRKS